MRPHLERLEALGAAARSEGIEEVYLLGMGGSSLCAEVLRGVLGVAEGAPELHVLDTTDEQTIHAAAARLTPAQAWFVVASKSGGTVEVSSMERFFWTRIQAALGERAGRQFIAITDPGTALEALALSRGYRELFVNPADIGGRFSALSLFGLVPATLIGSIGRPSADGRRDAGRRLPPGAPVESRARARCVHRRNRRRGTRQADGGAASIAGLARPVDRAAGCREHRQVRQGGAAGGRRSRSDGPTNTRNDRAFVAINTDRDQVDAARLAALEQAGHPVLRLSTRLDGLGAEFFRWEFATAVAGAALGINPFDEPNVVGSQGQDQGAACGDWPGRPAAGAGADRVI